MELATEKIPTVIMKNNLEDIPKNEVIGFDGVSTKFRQQLKPNYFMVWRYLVWNGMILLWDFLPPLLKENTLAGLDYDPQLHFYRHFCPSNCFFMKQPLQHPSEPDDQ
jgi:hypothetical protein